MSRASARCRSARVVVARDRVDQAETGEHEPEAAPVAERGAELERVLELLARRRRGRPATSARYARRTSDGRQPRVVAGSREARGALVEQRARPCECRRARGRSRPGSRARSSTAASHEISTNGCSVSSKTCRSAGPASGQARPDLGDVERRGDPSRRAARARGTRSMLSARSRSALAQVAAHPARDAERVDADRLGGGEALAPRELERPLEPRHARRRPSSLAIAELAEELQRPPLALARRRSRARRRGSPRRAPCRVRACRLRKSIAAAASSASARSAVRSGAAASAAAKRRFASSRSIRRSQNGEQRDAEARARRAGSRASSVSSAARRFAASRSSRGESRSRSASASAQRACRSASAAASPASSSRSRAYMRTVSSRR